MPMFVYHADCVGQETNCLYRHRVEITDEASLMEAVKYDYVCAEYRRRILTTTTVKTRRTGFIRGRLSTRFRA